MVSQKNKAYLGGELRFKAKTRVKILCTYLICCAAYQIVLLLWPGGVSPLLEPHAGLEGFIYMANQSGRATVEFMEIANSLFLLLVSVLVYFDLPILKFYLICESILILPTIIWAALMMPGQGGDVIEKWFVIPPLAVMCLFSIIPMIMAVIVLRTDRSFENETE